ncbi:MULTISPECIES: AMP-binding protein [unclassified Streptomyces]|uniref:AMP-binding protein n=1 Tax=unclassified Streptomyces TaxID=2593676 RepID=UPI001F266AD7|nr:AMP-binding protein [Streptomyces sp. NRRL F-2747]
MHEFLLSSAGASPEKPAVIEADPEGGLRTLSYGGLKRRTQEYAAALDALGLDVGDRVILESDTSASAIAAFLACSSLGLTFVPVTPSTPRERLLAVIGAAEPALYLQASDGKRTDLPEGLGTGRFGPEGLLVERAPAPRVRHRREVLTTDPAYMIFTSGTTGRPKGVIMTHRAIIAFYRGMLERSFVTAEDRVATTSPLQFDFSLLDIGLALGSGATVVPVPRARLPWPRRFLQFLADTGATQVNGAPSIWRPALRHEAAALAELTQLRGILYSGEAFPPPEIRHLQRLRPGIRIVNCFGSTESVACTFTDVPNPLPEDVDRLSIGRAHTGADITLVGEDGHVVHSPGAVGEIHLRSAALFSGYWGDPETTGRALVPDPLNPRSGQLVFRSGDLAYRDEEGQLFFCGRADSMAKIRGNRVELGEVERRLLGHPAVAAAAALALPAGDDHVLGAFLVLAPDADEPSAAQLTAFVAETLPAYMVPQELRILNSLPTTPNGKTDRAKLLATFTPVTV